MKFKASFYLVIVLLLLGSAAMAYDYRTKNLQVTDEQRPRVWLKTAKEFFEISTADLEVYRKQMKTLEYLATNRHLSAFEQPDKYVFVSIGTTSSPARADEINKTHQDPKQCYEIGLNWLKDGQNVSAARVWFKRAASLGHEQALIELNKLDDKIKADIKDAGFPLNGPGAYIFEYLGYE